MKCSQYINIESTQTQTINGIIWNSYSKELHKCKNKAMYVISYLYEDERIIHVFCKSCYDYFKKGLKYNNIEYEIAKIK